MQAVIVDNTSPQIDYLTGWYNGTTHPADYNQYVRIVGICFRELTLSQNDGILWEPEFWVPVHLQWLVFTRGLTFESIF